MDVGQRERRARTLPLQPAPAWCHRTRIHQSQFHSQRTIRSPS
jgi:hypothetical protein